MSACSSRWMLTGTPVTNSIKESESSSPSHPLLRSTDKLDAVRSLFQLLRVVEPLSDPQVWNQMIGVGPDSHKSDIYLVSSPHPGKGETDSLKR